VPLLHLPFYNVVLITAHSVSTPKLIKKFHGHDDGQQFISTNTITCGPHRRLVDGICVYDRSSAVAASYVGARQCDSDFACAPSIKGAYGLCVDDICQVYCERGTVYHNGQCSPIKSTLSSDAGTCQTDSDCETSVPFGVPICVTGRCSTGCAPGFVKVGSKCERALNKRGELDVFEEACESMPPPNPHHHNWKRSHGKDPDCPVGYRTAFAEGVYFCKPIKK